MHQPQGLGPPHCRLRPKCGIRPAALLFRRCATGSKALVRQLPSKSGSKLDPCLDDSVGRDLIGSALSINLAMLREPEEKRPLRGERMEGHC